MHHYKPESSPRLLAIILALVIEDLLIAQLWTQPLSQDSLTTAGRLLWLNGDPTTERGAHNGAV